MSIRIVPPVIDEVFRITMQNLHVGKLKYVPEIDPKNEHPNAPLFGKSNFKFI